MATFPTLQRRGTETHSPVVERLNSTLAHDPTIRSQSEGGYVTSRARFTRLPRRWVVQYRQLSQSNKNTLRAFNEDTVVSGSESFTWTNPEDGVDYTVRFLDPIQYTPEPQTNWLWWNVEFTFEEV